MSGLAVFFKDFLPKDNVPTYEQSTAAVPQTKKEENEDDAASFQDEWTEPLSFQGWKNVEQKVLVTYLQHRVFVADENEEATHSAVAKNNAAAGERGSQESREDEYSQQLETQALLELDGDDDNTSDALPDRPPHVSNAIHTAEFLTDVDLSSKQTNLKVLEVDRYWPMRKTDRPATSNIVPRRQPMIAVYQGPLKVPLSPCEDDGPLSCIYNSVLSLEVTQANKPTSDLRQRAVAAMQPDIPVYRMKIFLYNGYADRLQTIISKLSKKSQMLLLQLREIPPQCIFSLAMTSWVDSDLSQYCICLGGKSKMKPKDGNDTGPSLGFDSPDVELYAAIVEPDQVTKEFRIRPVGSSIVTEELQPDDHVVGPAYFSEKIKRTGGEQKQNISGTPSETLHAGTAEEIPQMRELETMDGNGPKASFTVNPERQAAAMKVGESHMCDEAPRAAQTESASKTAVDGTEHSNNRDHLTGTKSNGRKRSGGGSSVSESSGTGVKEVAPRSEILSPESERTVDPTVAARAVTPKFPRSESRQSMVYKDRRHTPAPKEMEIEEPPRPPRTQPDHDARANIVRATADKNHDGSSPKQVGIMEPAHEQKKISLARESVRDQTGAKLPASEQLDISGPTKPQREVQRENSISTNTKDSETQDAVRPKATNTVAPSYGGSDVENDRPSADAAHGADSTAGPPPLSPVDDNQARVDMSFRIVHAGKKSGTPPHPKDKPRAAYFYHRLEDLRAHLESHRAISRDQRTNSICFVNVFGVVLGFGYPSVTKTGDWMVTATLVDDSLPLENGSTTTDDSLKTVNVNIFMKEKDELPKLRVAGDVLRLHRVRLQEWKGDIQLLGMRGSSYVVCRNEDSQWSLFPTAKSFSLSDQEKHRFTDMWNWGQHRLFNHPTMKASLSFKLSDIHRQDSDSIELYQDGNSRGDLTAMVTGIVTCTPVNAISGTPVGFLRVWDGTGAPVSDSMVHFDPNASRGYSPRSVTGADPPDEALVRLADLVKKLRRLQPNKPLLQEPHAVTGRVVNVAIWESEFWDIVEERIRIGAFIRMRNIQESKLPETDIRCLHVHSKSHMTLLPDRTFEVVKLVEDHNARLERKDELNPSSGILPLEESEALEHPVPLRVRRAASISPPPKRHKPAEQSSLVDFNSLLYSEKTSSFKGVVKIFGTIPSFPILANGGIANIIFSKHNFAVKLEDDGLNQIDVIVNGQSKAASTILGASDGPAPRVDAAVVFLRTAIMKRWRWTAEIRSVILSGSKYFVLDNVKTCDTSCTSD